MDPESLAWFVYKDNKASGCTMLGPRCKKASCI